MITRVRRQVTGRGFTLVELAIVLAVTGVLFIGLYRLLSGGNQQVKDTATASQQILVINAVKTFLASSDGQKWMSSEHSTSGAAYPLTLPTSASCTYADPLLAPFCSYIPVGFVGAGNAGATLNPYGQGYLVQVLNGVVATAGAAPTTYSFLVYTTGGDSITDASGGRISSQVGGDGGFVYVNSNACVNTSTACGAYGGWAVALGSYGIGSPGAGHLVSRTYYSLDVNTLTPWLARQFMTGDSATSPDFNSMHTDFYLGTNLNTGLNNTLWLGSVNASATGGGTLNVQGGAINLSAGLLGDTISLGNAINISQSQASPNYLSVSAGGPGGHGSQAFETLSTGCTVTNAATPDCQVALQINGDENVTGQLQANTLFAGTFIYQQGAGSSDMRLKTNIQPVPSSALDSIMRMQPVSYAFKSDGQKSMGFIAQDMEKIYPNLVVQGTDGMKAIKYDGLIAPLVASVQELKKENDELKQELHDATQREEALEKRVK